MSWELLFYSYKCDFFKNTLEKNNYIADKQLQMAQLCTTLTFFVAVGTSRLTSVTKYNITLALETNISKDWKKYIYFLSGSNMKPGQHNQFDSNNF